VQIVNTFSLSGTVIHGNHMGRSLGYPTANLDLALDPSLSSKGGVYAVIVRYAGKIFGGMANIGYRPTIRENGFMVEVHLFSFSGELYGEWLDVDFIARIRDEVKFGSVQELTLQMQHDETAAREILSGLLNPDPDAV
jgi:riboflavin kinase/FMN adenylyltransferase